MIKMHTTNYFDTIILVAEDTKVNCGTKPPLRLNKPSIAELQYNLLVNNPYTFTSDDILFKVFADRNNLTKEDYPKAREDFFQRAKLVSELHLWPKLTVLGFMPTVRES